MQAVVVGLIFLSVSVLQNLPHRDGRTRATYNANRALEHFDNGRQKAPLGALAHSVNYLRLIVRQERLLREERT